MATSRLAFNAVTRSLPSGHGRLSLVTVSGRSRVTISLRDALDAPIANPYVTMSPEQAREVAAELIARADEIEANGWPDLASQLDGPGQLTTTEALAAFNEGARRVYCPRCERGHEGACK